MDLKEYKNRVHIPNNLKLKLEIFPGYGTKEFVITLASLGIAVIINLLIYTFYKNITFAFVSTFTIVAIAILGTLKDHNNTSFFYHLKRLFKYFSKQKVFNRINYERWKTK